MVISIQAANPTTYSIYIRHIDSHQSLRNSQAQDIHGYAGLYIFRLINLSLLCRHSTLANHWTANDELYYSISNTVQAYMPAMFLFSA